MQPLSRIKAYQEQILSKFFCGSDQLKKFKWFAITSSIKFI